MRDPYELLGVPRGASEEQINQAYREKARALQDAGGSEAEMAALNSAYDTLILQRGGSYTYAGQYGGAEFGDIRDRIRAGRLEDAQLLLDGIPEAQRNAEWYYLKGTVQQKRGWLEEAANNFARACDLDPANDTYKMAFNQVNRARTGGYRTERGSKAERAGCSACDICSGLLCADCCCECTGGDLIPCC